MTGSDETAERVEELLDTPHLADALESEQFRHFLDQIQKVPELLAFECVRQVWGVKQLFDALRCLVAPSHIQVPKLNYHSMASLVQSRRRTPAWKPLEVFPLRLSNAFNCGFLVASLPVTAY